MPGTITLVEGDTEMILLTECGDEPTLDRSLKSNWVQNTGGLPCYIDEIAKDIHDGGHPIGNAIQIAVGTVRNWCHGAKKVTAATRAKACAASAEWEARKAQAHASHALGEESFADVDIVATVEDGIIRLADGKGKPVPLVPDKTAWEMMGVTQMPHLKREHHIANVDGRKYRGRYQAVAGGASGSEMMPAVPYQMGECFGCNEGEAKEEENVNKSEAEEKTVNLFERFKNWLLGEDGQKALSEWPEPWQRVADDIKDVKFTFRKPEESITGEEDAETTDLAEFVDKPWNGSASRFGSTEAYCSSCLIDENPSGAAKTQSKCHLPVKEPGGAYNKAGLRAAAARLNQVQASSGAKSSARSRLKSLMSQAGITTNLSEEEFDDLLKIYEAEEPVEESPQEEPTPPESGNTLYQLPYEESELVALESSAGEAGKRLYKKVIAHADRIVKHGEGYLDHSKETLEKMVENFKKRAVDQVPLFTRHRDKSTKETDVFAYLGETVDLALEDNNLVAYFELTPKGEEVVKENPNLPTSMGYDPDYTRQNDDTYFGPILDHVATVFRPHLHGLGSWEPVNLQSEAETNVVDLTAAVYSDLEERKEAEPVSEDVKTPEAKEEEVKMEEPTVNLKTGNAKTDNVKTESRESMVTLDEFNSLKAELDRQRRVTRQQGIRKMLNETYGNDVEPVYINDAYTLLSAEDSLINLSEAGEATLAEDEKAKAIINLLEGLKVREAERRFMEEGHSFDGEPEDEAYKAWRSAMGEEVTS